MARALLQAGGGLLESVGQVAVVAASLLLVLMLVALGSFVYRSLQGDGIEWPDDVENDEDDGGVQRGSDDDEWDYY